MNLTDSTQFLLTLPVCPMWEGSAGQVLEVVFWSDLVSRWIHVVSEHFSRELPPGHVQVTQGDLVWLERVVARAGERGLLECIAELESEMEPAMSACN